VQGPNYDGVQALMEVTRNDKPVTVMTPEKRVYRVQGTPMTEAAIDRSPIRDLYVSLGETVAGGAWIVRVYYKPFVDWIWGGCLMMALGGALAASDRRYRVKKPRPAEATFSDMVAASTGNVAGGYAKQESATTTEYAS
jgi:cytochrome c-type biogenesis protein CcmF